MKRLVALVAVGLCLLLATHDRSIAQQQKPARISIATAGTGGSYFPIGAAIADVLNRNIPGVQAKAETTGGAAENIQLVGSGQSDLGITTSYLAYFGINGMEPYKQKLPELTVLFTGFQAAPLQIVTSQKSGINSIKDLKGKKVGLGPRGGASLLLIKDLFEFNDFKISDVGATYATYEDSAQGLQDGQLDAIIIGAAHPTTSIQGLVANKFPTKLISIPDAACKAFLEKYPYYGRIVIPKDMYSLREDAQAIIMPNLMIVRKALDANLVYAIDKAIFENLKDIYAAHPAAAAIKLETAAQKLGLPFHPGAEKYFKEKGMLK
jgi:TRAP transporter TAXI family solute receptor